MSEQQSPENDAPVTRHKCPDCGAEPGRNCTGPGTGWHLSRWDRMWDSRVTPTEKAAAPPPVDRLTRNAPSGDGASGHPNIIPPASTEGVQP